MGQSALKHIHINGYLAVGRKDNHRYEYHSDAKRRHYFTTPTMREYVLVDQDATATWN